MRNMASLPPLTSLMRSAPNSSTAMRATSGRKVSMERGRGEESWESWEGSELSENSEDSENSENSENSELLENSEISLLTTGSAFLRRSISSCSLTSCALGRVEQAPTSMMVPPSATICLTRWAMACLVCMRLSAKKESGVTFRMPITRGGVSASRRPFTLSV